uniref:Uncharacterized protein n=1 Tax=Tetradesmus obliquus TaxID=3088 RepID=A0A383VR23_TETOB|eukprot:jgi/Sobl393_1/11810/SZX67299.1
MRVEQVAHNSDDNEWGCLMTFEPTGSMSLLPLGLVNSAERTEQRRSWWFGLVLCWAGWICCSTSGCMMK